MIYIYNWYTRFSMCTCLHIHYVFHNLSVYLYIIYHIVYIWFGTFFFSYIYIHICIKLFILDTQNMYFFSDISTRWHQKAFAPCHRVDISSPETKWTNHWNQVWKSSSHWILQVFFVSCKITSTTQSSTPPITQSSTQPTSQRSTIQPFNSSFQPPIKQLLPVGCPIWVVQ